MSSTQSFTSRAYHGYSSEYNKGSQVMIDYDSSSVFAVDFTASTDNSWITINSTGKGKLFPNSTAHPIKADISFYAGKFGLSSGEIRLYVNGTQIFNQSVGNKDYSFTGRKDSAILNSTKSTEVKWVIAHGTLTGTGINNISVTYYFTRYDFTANGENCSASVSSSTGYDGDTVTFTAVPNSACTFLGWYNGDTRITTSRTYTHTVAGADLTLTAKATAAPKRRRYLLCGNDIKLGDEISENISVTYGSTTLVESLNGAKTLLCKSKYMADKVYVGTRSANCADSVMPYQLVAMLCYGDWIPDMVLQGGAVGYISQTGWCVTPFLPVPDGCTNITVEAGGTQSNSILHEFDGDFGYLSYWGGSSNPRTFSFDYPAEIKYVRASFHMADIQNCFIKDNTHDIYIFRGGNV